MDENATPSPERKISVRCTQCSREYLVSAAHLGKKGRCQTCGATFPVLEATPSPAAVASPSQPPADAEGFCAICQAHILTGEPTMTCPDCKTVYHKDCWEYNKGCGMYGCPQSPPTEKLNTLEIPMSFWGKEQKACPSCRREIQAAAIRCRHCGATFQSARPEDTAGFHARRSMESNLPRVRKGTIWLLIFSLLPCTALLAAIFGGIWYLRHKQEVQNLPSLYSALCKLSLVVAIGQSAFGILVAILHSVSQ